MHNSCVAASTTATASHVCIWWAAATGSCLCCDLIHRVWDTCSSQLLSKVLQFDVIYHRRFSIRLFPYFPRIMSRFTFLPLQLPYKEQQNGSGMTVNRLQITNNVALRLNYGSPCPCLLDTGAYCSHCLLLMLLVVHPTSSAFSTASPKPLLPYEVLDSTCASFGQLDAIGDFAGSLPLLCWINGC